MFLTQTIVVLTIGQTNGQANGQNDDSPVGPTCAFERKVTVLN